MSRLYGAGYRQSMLGIAAAAAIVVKQTYQEPEPTSVADKSLPRQQRRAILRQQRKAAKSKAR